MQPVSDGAGRRCPTSLRRARAVLQRPMGVAIDLRQCHGVTCENGENSCYVILRWPSASIFCCLDFEGVRSNGLAHARSV